MFALLISNGMLFQIKALEKDKLFLNIVKLGFGVFESERKAITYFHYYSLKLGTLP